ncbi:ubiquinol-cytochrome c reductase cytochrome b subunit [Streptomyces sp. HNM0663]|uniref:Cytochrome bc1 complex cytochrome b subunit n=1 Tax=Streptomyces chengmaiensis TaxID=3040919 RepID=A0ABT6HV24_9ACTN|nr:ubiquinol-cytochrome c reductase cytochrome b subunit [Streptomyces chengmaiensis]MDH2392562.1 ubiquinol-cytochrome c reductase cytochrome b subunit [Streptomyces chengmaiensis]
MLLHRHRARMRERARAAAAGGFTGADRRLPVAELSRQLMRKAFPDHWSFLLGEVALYSFAVLLLTGVYLTLFFDPSMAEGVYDGPYAPLQGVSVTQAYASTMEISFSVRGGLLIRQIHHWAALVFVAAVAVHMLRVFFTGAFRRPREGNWVIGVTLFMLAMLEGFAGYSLPDDLLSGTGLRTAATIVRSIPVVGTYLEMAVFGGQFPGEVILPRLYIVHVLLVPGLMLALIAAHLILVVYLKHTHWAGQGRTNRNVVGQPMFPQFTAKTTGFFFLVFGVLTVLGAVAQINPVWNYGPYRADQISTDVQPDWYVGFLEGALRLMPPWQTEAAGHTVMWNVFIPALVLPGLLFGVLYLYPYAERWVTGERGERHLCDRPRNAPTRTGLGVAGVVFYAVLLVAGGNDVVAFGFLLSLEATTWVLRVALVVAPPLAFVIAKRLCLALQERDRRRLARGVETGEVTQSVSGGLSEGHRPLPPAARYRILMRDVPAPLKLEGHEEPEGLEEPRAPRERREGGEGARAGEGGPPRRRRLRVALSGWYYGDVVDLPATDEQRAAIAERTRPPEFAEHRER